MSYRLNWNIFYSHKLYKNNFPYKIQKQTQKWTILMNWTKKPTFFEKWVYFGASSERMGGFLAARLPISCIPNIVLFIIYPMNSTFENLPIYHLQQNGNKSCNPYFSHPVQQHKILPHECTLLYTTNAKPPSHISTPHNNLTSRQ